MHTNKAYYFLIKLLSAEKIIISKELSVYIAILNLTHHFDRLNPQGSVRSNSQRHDFCNKTVSMHTEVFSNNSTAIHNSYEVYTLLLMYLAQGRFRKANFSICFCHHLVGSFQFLYKANPKVSSELTELYIYVYKASPKVCEITIVYYQLVILCTTESNYNT